MKNRIDLQETKRNNVSNNPSSQQSLNVAETSINWMKLVRDLNSENKHSSYHSLKHKLIETKQLRKSHSKYERRIASTRELTYLVTYRTRGIKLKKLGARIKGTSEHTSLS